MWRFHNWNSKGVLQMLIVLSAWCWPEGLEHQRGRGLHIWYPCESEKSPMRWRSRWPGMLRWHGCETAWAALYFMNAFSRIGKIIMKRNVACARKASQVLSLQVDSVPLRKHYLSLSSLLYANFWERRFSLVGRDGRPLWHLCCILHCKL